MLAEIEALASAVTPASPPNSAAAYDRLKPETEERPMATVTAGAFAPGPKATTAVFPRDPTCTSEVGMFRARASVTFT
jgi:hypothetical protein